MTYYRLANPAHGRRETISHIILEKDGYMVPGTKNCLPDGSQYANNAHCMVSILLNALLPSTFDQSQ